VAAFKSPVSKIFDTGVKLLAATRKMSIVEDDHPGSPKKLDGGDIVSEITWQMIP
jgi:hypothetical protein